MQRLFSGIGIVLLFLLMIFSPDTVFYGAQEGLLLWFQIVFPTLFPFLIISGLLMAGGGLDIISRIFGGILQKVFSVSRQGAFCILTGFLCGYPMGAKTAADLVRSRKITVQEGRYLLSFCNNTSPVFIINFIALKTFHSEKLILPSLSILISVPVMLSFVFRRFYLKNAAHFPDQPCTAVSSSGKLDISRFEECMEDSFESIVKVGGYIICFSVLTGLLEKIAGSRTLSAAVLPLLEMTNGIVMIHKHLNGFSFCYPFVIGLTAFGGFCSAAQTDCMIRGSEMPFLPYMIEKLAAGLAASFLAYLYVFFF